MRKSQRKESYQHIKVETEKQGFITVKHSSLDVDGLSEHPKVTPRQRDFFRGGMRTGKEHSCFYRSPFHPGICFTANVKNRTYSF